MGLSKDWRKNMKKVIKVKYMPPEWQKNYNAFYQKMVNASEEERHQIVEDRKRKVIEKIRRL